METGAIVAVTRQGADVGDTTTIIETAIAAAEQVEDAQANVDDRQSLEEIVGEKGYHSNQTLIDLDAVGIRSYVSEPDRGRRDWSKDPEARAPVYGNRRRMRGRRGRRLMRQRGERIERSFAHLYDTGGMRRTHLRGHTNILKRLLIHAGGFNLGLVMRHLIGIGTPRGLQGRVAAVRATLGVLMGVVRRRLTTISSSHRLIPAVRGWLASLATFAVNSSAAITCTTGCYGVNYDSTWGTRPGSVRKGSRQGNLLTMTPGNGRPRTGSFLDGSPTSGWPALTYQWWPSGWLPADLSHARSSSGTRGTSSSAGGTTTGGTSRVGIPSRRARKPTGMAGARRRPFGRSRKPKSLKPAHAASHPQPQRRRLRPIHRVWHHTHCR